MPVRNAESSVCIAVESILRQTHSDLELIIIDDESTDRTSLLLKKYLVDPRVLVHRNEFNLGLTKSLNLAAGLSNGQYLARMDADDQSLPDRLNYQLSHLAKGVDLCGTRAILSCSGKITPRISCLPSAQLLIRNIFVHGSLMFTRRLFDQVGGYDESLSVAQDYGFLVDAILSGAKISIAPAVQYILATNPGGITSVRFDEQVANAREIKKAYRLSIFRGRYVRRNI